MQGGGSVLKRKIERSLGKGGRLKSKQVRTRGEGEGSKNHPIYANVIIEWSPGVFHSTPSLKLGTRVSDMLHNNLFLHYTKFRVSAKYFFTVTRFSRSFSHFFGCFSRFLVKFLPIFQGSSKNPIRMFISIYRFQKTSKRTLK